MSFLSRPFRLRGMAWLGIAAMLQAAVTTPAGAEAGAPLRVLPAPIATPLFVTPVDPDTNGHGLAPDRVSLALGAALVGDYEGSSHYVLAPIAGASARLHGHLLLWHGNSLGIDLVPEYRNRRFKIIVAPMISLNLNRTQRSHDQQVALLPDRKLAVEGGGVIGFSRTGVLTSPEDMLTVQIAATHDLGNVHRSFILTPSVFYVAPISKAALISASASFDLVGAGYAQTYFGIDSADSAVSGLPGYRPGGGIKSAAIGVGALRSLRGDLRHGFAVGVLLNYERLLGAFARSPLVAVRGNPNQFIATLGMTYTF